MCPSLDTRCTKVNKAEHKRVMSRRARFRAAISLAQTTAKEWCVEHDITEGHLYQVLRGTRQSPPLLEKVDAFIAAQLDGKVTAA